MIQRLHPRPRSRAGITLTEILISIMIMGIGLVSLATLFPLGLLRIREANRASRSALLVESAIADMQGRNLLDKRLFSFWYAPPLRPAFYDPFIHDPASPNDLAQAGGIYREAGKGLPIAYDPLWWYETYVNTDNAITPINTSGRFASGIGWIRNDPGGGNPSAHGLQRITNFNMLVGAEIEKTFASTDDIVFQSDGRPSAINPATGLAIEGIGSPLAPDMSTDGMMADLSYTWIFTGHQIDATNATQFDGDIVVFHNRPFGIEEVISPITGSAVTRVRGETVVEAIFGYGPPANNGYALSNHTVLLRWPANMPDPDIRVGGYIADVTYERNSALAGSRFEFPGAANSLNGEIYPAQRCFWYRIVKRTDPVTDANGNRRMVVHINSPVRAKTRMSAVDTPFHFNAALVSPYVVNVVPRTFYTR